MKKRTILPLALIAILTPLLCFSRYAGESVELFFRPAAEPIVQALPQTAEDKTGDREGYILKGKR